MVADLNYVSKLVGQKVGRGAGLERKHLLLSQSSLKWSDSDFQIYIHLYFRAYTPYITHIHTYKCIRTHNHMYNMHMCVHVCVRTYMFTHIHANRKHVTTNYKYTYVYILNACGSRRAGTACSCTKLR